MPMKFSLSSEERALVVGIFAQADQDNCGFVSATVAVSILSSSGLSTTNLGDVWGIADEDNI